MKDSLTNYFNYRIKLEKAKQRTWLLKALVKFLSFLAIVVSYYLG
jgi:hypothetical protein